MSSSTRCAACRYLRRRCPQDCVLAPYFPSSDPDRFDCVHKIFGASNVTKMLRDLPAHLRGDAADCLCLEASWRVQNPVYGCVGIVSQLKEQIIEVQSEIIKTKTQIALIRHTMATTPPLPPPPPPPRSYQQEEIDSS